jgi:hypothetical protein
MILTINHTYLVECLYFLINKKRSIKEIIITILLTILLELAAGIYFHIIFSLPHIIDDLD